MTESEYFANFIKQHRAELPKTSALSDFISDVSSILDDLASDYLLNNCADFITSIQEPNLLHIKISKQEILDGIASTLDERARVLDLSRLFVHELKVYDSLFGQPSSVEFWNSTEERTVKAYYLMGCAIGLARDFPHPTTIVQNPIPPKNQVVHLKKRWQLSC